MQHQDKKHVSTAPEAPGTLPPPNGALNGTPGVGGSLASPILQRERIINLAAKNKVDAIKELVALLGHLPEVEDAAELLNAVLEREREMSTAMGYHCAMPHAKVLSVRDFLLAIGVSRDGIAFDAPDEQPVHLVVLIVGPLLGPLEGQRRYLQLLRHVGGILADEGRREKILGAGTLDAVYEAFKTLR